MVFSFTAIVSATVGASLVVYRPILRQIFHSLQPDRSRVQNTPLRADNSWRSHFKSTINRPVNILVMGIEPVLGGNEEKEVFSGPSDTLLLLRFDPVENQLRVLSIPGDTRVRNAKLKIPKINRANLEGGAELAVEIGSQTLNNLPIDRYLRLTTGAFRELVDLLGGIEIFVPQQMYYRDQTQNFTVDLKPGWQTLNGEQAEQFVRFRDEEYGDLGRIQRQQALLKALYHRLHHLTVLSKLPRTIEILRQYMDTDLTREEVFTLVGFAFLQRAKDLQMVLLPGRESRTYEYKYSYWLPNRDGRDRILKDYFAGVETWRSEKPRPTVHRLRIAIHNTTEEGELAAVVLDYLQGKGFYNAYLTNNSTLELRQTEIIVQSGDLKAAEALKKVLGLGTVEISSLGDLDSDLTVRVGQDWHRRQDLLNLEELKE